MGFDPVNNFAITTVSVAPSPATSGTTITAADTSVFPDVGDEGAFNVVVWPADVQPTAANSEIVRITEYSAPSWTIIRAQEGTSARTIVAGDQLAANITAKTLTDIQNATQAFYFAQLSSPQFWGPIQAGGPMTSNPSLTRGAITNITLPLISYAPGEIVGGFELDVENISTLTDEFDLNVRVIVLSSDGSSNLVLTCSGVVTSPNTEGSLDFSTAAVNVTGPDLSWDGSNILTASGGSYSVFMKIAGVDD